MGSSPPMWPRRWRCDGSGECACASDKNVRYLRLKGREFIARVLQLARVRNLPARVDEKRGKGSHVTLYLGSRLTVVRNRKDELKTGTLHAMCRQLGIRREDL